jgi:hypothetical protein
MIVIPADALLGLGCFGCHYRMYSPIHSLDSSVQERCDTISGPIHDFDFEAPRRDFPPFAEIGARSHRPLSNLGIYIFVNCMRRSAASLDPVNTLSVERWDGRRLDNFRILAYLAVTSCHTLKEFEYFL